MSRRTCPIQDLCHKFNIGNNPLDHWHRTHTPCMAFLDMSCEQSVNIQMFLGDTMACDFRKVERIKKEVMGL